MEERTWRKPELIILVRNKPEEQVLTYCKGGGTTESFLSHDSGCHSDSGCTNECQDAHHS